MRKLAWATGSFSAAVFAACYLIPGKWRLIAAGILLLMGAAGFLLRGNMRKRVFLAACFAALGLSWTQAHHLVFIAPAQELDGLDTVAAFRVTDYPQDCGNYTLVQARLIEAGMPKVRVSLYDYSHTSDSLSPGDLIEAPVRLRSATTRYDEEIWSYTSRGVFLTGSLLDAPEVAGQWNWQFLNFPKQLGKLLKEQVQRFFPEDVAPLMCALLTGDKTALYQDTRLCISMQEAGLMHIVAVSGMHIAFLVSFIRLLTGNGKPAAMVCIPVIVLFIAMTGGSPSVVRAGFMQIFLLFSAILRAESDDATSLCAVLALLLLCNPQSARSTSLQLSFAAIAGIMLFSGRIFQALYDWARKLFRIKRKGVLSLLLRFLFSSLSSTLGALSISAPIIALTFENISLISPLTNLLTLSVISVCFSGGLICCIIGAVFPFLGTALGRLLAWGLRYVEFIVQGLGSARFACVYSVNPLVAVWLVLVYVILALCWVFRGKRGFRPTVPVCASLCLLMAAVLFTHLADNRDALRFTALDVGQGQSLVMQSAGEAVVIDCGGPESEGAGETAANYLESRFLRGVSALILTHVHTDHANGVSELLWRVPVGTLILPADKQNDSVLLGEILAAANARGTEVIYLEQDSILTVGDLELTLFAPAAGDHTNERGIAVLGKCKGFDFLITGDMGTEGELRLLSHTELPQTELLVVGHHGSRYSTGDELLQQLRPETAIISVGNNNSGHPHAETLARLSANGVKLYRTDHSGSITLRVSR